MRGSLIAAAALALAGCGSSAAEEAEEEYEFIKKNSYFGYSAEKCAAAEKVRDAWLERRNEQQYFAWQGIARADCSRP